MLIHATLMSVALVSTAIGRVHAAKADVDIGIVSLSDSGVARFDVTFKKQEAFSFEKRYYGYRIFSCRVLSSFDAPQISAYGPTPGYSYANAVGLFGFRSAGADVKGPVKKIDDPQTGKRFIGGPGDGPTGVLYQSRTSELFRLEKIVDESVGVLRPVLPPVGDGANPARHPAEVRAKISSKGGDNTLWQSASGSAMVYVEGDTVRVFSRDREIEDKETVGLFAAVEHDAAAKGWFRFVSEPLDLIVVPIRDDGSRFPLRCFRRGDPTASRDVIVTIPGRVRLLDAALVGGDERFLWFEYSGKSPSLLVTDSTGDVVADLAKAKDRPADGIPGYPKWSGARFADGGKEVLACRINQGRNGELGDTSMTFVRWDIAQNSCRCGRLETAAFFTEEGGEPVVRNATAPPSK